MDTRNGIFFFFFFIFFYIHFCACLQVNSLTKNMELVCMAFYGGETMKDQVGSFLCV